MIADEKGITLIELILAAALVSIILGIVAMFYYFGMLSFDNDSIRANNQQNMRLVINDITKEIRNVGADETITVDQANSTITIDTIVYKLQGNKIMKNSNVLMENVNRFDVSLNGNYVSVEIESTPSRLGTTDSLKTTIAMRK
ncbi:MAG: hypothetical protein GXY49_13460 [Syntrophomonadaceae bacterium]|nr:hypothetical protein [Syntrophomonadaceae bacterium]